MRFPLSALLELPLELHAPHAVGTVVEHVAEGLQLLGSRAGKHQSGVGSPAPKAFESLEQRRQAFARFRAVILVQVRVF